MKGAEGAQHFLLSPQREASIKPELILMTSNKPQAKIMKTLTPVTLREDCRALLGQSPLFTQLPRSSQGWAGNREAPQKEAKGRTSAVAQVPVPGRWLYKPATFLLEHHNYM